MWRIKSIVRGNGHLCYTSFSINCFRPAALRPKFSDLWYPLFSITSRLYFLVASYFVICGSTRTFWLCRLIYLCLHCNWIILWFKWCRRILNHSLGGFPFGLPLPHPSFHWNQIKCCCYDIRLLVSAWRIRLVSQATWLIFIRSFLMSSLDMRRGNFVFDLAYLWGFPPLSPLV